MICPVELVTTFFARIGFKLKRPQWILSGWVMTFFYMIVLIAGVTILQIDLNPEYTSYYLLIILIIAVFTGLIFEKNTFCRYICPVGYLLGIFSKLAAWGWRVKKKPVCDGCRDKSCISGSYTYQLNYKSCGVDLVPAEIDNNSHCLLCGGCLKTCKTYKTINNSLRPNPAIVKTGFATDLMQIRPLRMAEWFFLFLLTGSMIFEMTHFKVISDIGASVLSNKISAGIWLTDGLFRNLALAAYLFLFLPGLIWLLPFALIKFSGNQLTRRTYVKDASLIFIPVIAAFFVGLSIMEIVTKFPFYRFIIKDVRGVETIKALLFRQIEMPQLPIWIDTAFIIILLTALAGGILLSYRMIPKQLIKFGFKENSKILYVLPLVFILLLAANTFLFLCF
jgi:hypothetical protein